jgi:hypothetical protein
VNVASAPGSPGSPGASIASLTGLAQSTSVWRAGNALATFSRKHSHPVGTTFSFTLDKAAAVRMDFAQLLTGRTAKGKCAPARRSNRHGRRCTRAVGAGSLTAQAHAGINKVHFEGRLTSTQKLGPGRYQLTVTAINSAGSSGAQSLTFTIVRR